MHKVLIISGTPIVSGAEYVLGDYLENTQYKKNIQIIHSDIQKVGDFYKKFEVDKIYSSKYLNPAGVVNNKLAALKKIFNLAASFFDFFKVFKNKKIKLTVGNNTGDVVYSFYSHFFGKKHINFVHDILDKDMLLAKTVLLFDKYVSEYIAVSQAVKDSMVKIGINENKINVIYNGLNSNESFLEKDIKNEIIFGFVGNIEERKNPLEFIEFIKTAQNILRIKIKGYMVYGNIIDKNLFKKIKKEIKRSELDIELIENIPREKMANFYEKIHYLVVTSKKDPFPTVILEAFNNGVPVIGHNIDGIKEMIENDNNGFLYDSKNDFEKILRNLENITYEKFQKNSWLTIRNKFSLSKRIKTIDKLLFEKGVS